MKKIVFVTAIIFAFLLVSGCGKPEENKTVENITRDTVEKTDNDASGTTETEVSPEVEKEKEEEPSAEAVVLAEISNELKNKVSAKDALDLDSSAISSLYGINSADISQGAGFVVMAGTFPHEVVMVEAKDSAAADRIETLLKTKHSAFVEQSKGYDAENYALACKCKVERFGNHISMFLTPDFETMRTIYTNYVE